MSAGTEMMHDPEMGTVIINDTDVSDDAVFSAFVDQHPELAALTRWGNNAVGASRRGGIFERDRFVTPDKIFDQFKVALDAAVTDDVVSGILETSESLAFNKARIDCQDRDEEDIWNQVAEDLFLEERLREIWRELFVVSQAYVGVLWGRKSYRVRGRNRDGNKRRKAFENIMVPTSMTILDPLKVVPYGNFLFGQEQLAYIATRDEATGIDDVLAGGNSSDLAVNQLLAGKIDLDYEEKKFLNEITGKNVDYLYRLNPRRVFRITSTRPDYMRFADVRMKSVFELLDLKHQLRQMDRAHLIGGTNFIVLVKKGSDNLPAKQSEVNTLAGQVRNAARVPVIVGDHRVEIEIITPKTDNTLRPERYNSIDARITARLYQMFMTGNYSAGAKGDDSVKLARVVAKGMEARRSVIARMIERNVFMPAFEANRSMEEIPRLTYIPKMISLEFDANLTNFFMELRDRGDISRETLLAQVDINQEEEARKREREEEDGLDEIFTPTNVPYGVSPDNNSDGGDDEGNDDSSPTPEANGRRGGNRNGGGTNPQSFNSGPPRGENRES